MIDGAVHSELQRHGFTVNNHQFIDAALSCASPFEILDGLHKKIQDAMPEKVKSSADLIIVIVQERAVSPHYNQIKYWGDCERGVPTQIISSVNFFKEKAWRPIHKFLSMKINAKLGGVSLQLCSWNEIPYRERVCKNIRYGKFLAFGADVTHPDAGSTDPSLAAVIGSLDYSCSLYGAKILQQRGGVEIMTELEFAVRDLLLDFLERNNTTELPEVLLTPHKEKLIIFCLFHHV